MKMDEIQKAKKAAVDFIESVDDVERAEAILNKYDTSPKHRGAMRRRSMDLTRALSEMRRR